MTRTARISREDWPPAAWSTVRASSCPIALIETLNIIIDGGAGGRSGSPGDYLYGDHRLPYREAGLWGLFRVYPKDDGEAGIIAIQEPRGSGSYQSKS